MKLLIIFEVTKIGLLKQVKEKGKKIDKNNGLLINIVKTSQ